jgi:imidazolonepropionase-like amidohydrolase
LVLALRAARLFDGERLLSPSTVLVDGASIVGAGVALPETVPVVDLGDATLLPGLIDCHQHLCFDGRGTLEEQVSSVENTDLVARARACAARALRGGVTTLRDLGDRGFVTLGLRDDVSLPTILASGPPITRHGGHCWFLGGECSSDADLRRAVAVRAERECDVVKVMATGGYLTPTFPMWDAQFSVDELRIVVEEAHRVGLPVAAHCHGIVGIERALDAGTDSIEHCTFYTSNERPEPNESLLARLASSGVVVSATLGRLPDHPLAPNLAAHYGTLLEARRRLVELGATLVAGTDAGIGPAKPHDVLPYAFGDLILSGMNPIDALRSLTMIAARSCGAGDRKGRLAPGFDADIIAVAGNPLLDPDALTSISAIWRAGSRIS